MEIIMLIIAFSDWRVQDIELFLDYLEGLEEKPDVIVYAGDDIERFNRVPYRFLPNELKKEYRRQFIWEYEEFEDLGKKALEKIILQYEVSNGSEINQFEKVANYSKYGLCVVAGNDDSSYIKEAIRGKNVYDVHENPVIIDNFAIIGVEGSSGEIGHLLYTEQEIKSHIENKIQQVGDRQLIIVSHSPPFEILDFSIRAGKRHIGSTSLRDFIEKYSAKIPLVISGHVHLQGEKSEKYKETHVVNCASHDNPGASGRIALIDISQDNVDIKWKIQYGLTMVPMVADKREAKLRKHGILHVEQLAALRFNNQLYQKIPEIPENTLYLIINYAKAIDSKKIIHKKEIKSAFDNIENKNIYFFDAEYNIEGTINGPYGIFLLGWMDRNGKVQQLFLDEPKDEKKILTDFSQWVEKEKPLFIAYASRSADVPHLRNSFGRCKLSFQHIKKSFFDLYTDLIYTQNRNRQKYFLPVPGSLGLKDVSEFFGYQKQDLPISDGILAPIEYEKFLNSKDEEVKERIKKDLLTYNEDDLKRTKFIYDQLKTIG